MMDPIIESESAHGSIVGDLPSGFSKYLDDQNRADSLNTHVLNRMAELPPLQLLASPLPIEINCKVCSISGDPKVMHHQEDCLFAPTFCVNSPACEALVLKRDYIAHALSCAYNKCLNSSYGCLFAGTYIEQSIHQRLCRARIISLKNELQMLEEEFHAMVEAEIIQPSVTSPDDIGVVGLGWSSRLPSKSTPVQILQPRSSPELSHKEDHDNLPLFLEHSSLPSSDGIPDTMRRKRGRGWSTPASTSHFVKRSGLTSLDDFVIGLSSPNKTPRGVSEGGPDSDLVPLTPRKLVAPDIDNYGASQGMQCAQTSLVQPSDHGAVSGHRQAQAWNAQTPSSDDTPLILKLKISPRSSR